MRAFRLRGEPSDLVVALERVHVLADVLGVVEREGELELFLDAEPPDLRDLAIEVIELTFVPKITTGLEQDRAITIGDRLVVRPPWVEPPPDFGGIELVVPRGMAFGSGEHGSTQAALLALDLVWPTPAPGNFLDVGTGSGVLALFARARGIEAICACDVEDAAVHAARELITGSDVRLGGPEVFAPARFAAVVANLDAGQLDAAIEMILARWDGTGPLVLSGMRSSEVAALRSRMPESAPRRIERGGYVALGWSGDVVGA